VWDDEEIERGKKLLEIFRFGNFCSGSKSDLRHWSPDYLFCSFGFLLIHMHRMLAHLF
jgi:hypothetical protein